MSILDEAAVIIHGDRERAYGHPARNLEKIAQQWRLFLLQKYDVDVAIDAEDVCYMMADLKKVRQMHDHKHDNLVDGVGYIALVERIYAHQPQAQSTDTAPA